MSNEPKTIQSWSGGKDSTASIILEHLHGMCAINRDVKTAPITNYAKILNSRK